MIEAGWLVAAILLGILIGAGALFVWYMFRMTFRG